MSQFAYILFDSIITLFLHKYFRDLCINFHANKQMVFSWYEISNQSPTLVFFSWEIQETCLYQTQFDACQLVWFQYVFRLGIYQGNCQHDVKLGATLGHQHCVNIRHEIFSQSFQTFFYFVLVISYDDDLCAIYVSIRFASQAPGQSHVEPQKHRRAYWLIPKKC